MPCRSIRILINLETFSFYSMSNSQQLLIFYPSIPIDRLMHSILTIKHAFRSWLMHITFLEWYSSPISWVSANRGVQSFHGLACSSHPSPYSSYLLIFPFWIFLGLRIFAFQIQGFYYSPVPYAKTRNSQAWLDGLHDIESSDISISIWISCICYTASNIISLLI